MIQCASANRRGLSSGTVLFLVFILVAAGLIYYMNERRGEDAKVAFFNEQLAPESLIDRVEIETTKTQSLGADSWERLLSLMSADDRRWIENNVSLLAGLNRKATEGTDKLDKRERMFRALEYVLRLNESNARHIVVRIGVDDKSLFGVAYVHPPGSIKDLKEEFLCNENGAWRMRRFMGRRDDPELMEKLIAAKGAAKVPLSPDEEAFKKDPKLYAATLREGMLKEAGIASSSAPAAKPQS